VTDAAALLAVKPARPYKWAYQRRTGKSARK
jgi:hypothetical protein